jgi:two-component system chemotaxis response regulator CheY
MADILVVDDSPIVRSLVRVHLTGRGYNFTEAADGLEALTLARAKSFTLIVADLDMPKLSGYSLIRELRGTKDALSRTAPIVVLSSWEPTGLDAEFLDKEGCLFCPKPVGMSTLTNAIDRLLARTQPD